MGGNPSPIVETMREILKWPRNADKHSDKGGGSRALTREKPERAGETESQSQTEACSLEMRLEQQTGGTLCFVLRDSWDQAHMTRMCLVV